MTRRRLALVLAGAAVATPVVTALAVAGALLVIVWAYDDPALQADYRRFVERHGDAFGPRSLP